ncbi:hypothetical protein BO78DRAFT_397022 [Aspergillus sclerotiicarbonarius CBS 121057]|uniref:Uncharacterized protein n=1 Tax=Aspergillus sclerotiicarbonarius (strain CBS 121057 / IBT 28362) TaxID=1448318 RepID=A0A319ES27_ASPSB|nr:hypothetical protein BO78DRAFT_397022 [Aspergillus sclerotiicarbonarius CBS 121057]
MSLPSQRKFNTNTGPGFNSSPAVSGGLKRSNALFRKREERNPLIDRQQTLTFNPPMSKESTCWNKHDRKENLRPDMNRDKGKRPENYGVGTFASPSTKKHANSYANPSPKRGGVETDARKVRWPFLG